MIVKGVVLYVFLLWINSVCGQRRCYKCDSPIFQECDINANRTALQADCGTGYTGCLTVQSSNGTVTRRCAVLDACTSLMDNGLRLCSVCTFDLCNYQRVTGFAPIHSYSLAVTGFLVVATLVLFS